MQRSRQQVKTLRLAARRGDMDAARVLLAHSVALRHERLGIRRYFAARFLGVRDIDQFKPFCLEASHHLPPEALLAAARNAVRDPEQRKDFHVVASELLSPWTPVILPYDGIRPRLAADPRGCGRGVSLLGRIEIGADSFFGLRAVVRADGHFVKIGDDFCLGEAATVHIAHGVYPTIIGDRVAVGRNAVVHACTVGNECVIEGDAVILDGTKLEDGVLVEAGSVVFPRSTLKPGLVYAGSPAKPVRQLEPGERARRALLIQDAAAASLFVRASDNGGSADNFPARIFFAATAHRSGRVEAGPGSSIFFGCELNAGSSAIIIGDNSNVQDNTVIDASEGAVTIGANTTIGHNVRMRACSVGARTLIGIGSNIGTGTVVEGDVLLAAGATTEPAQHLVRGWLWGGRPARPISKLDDARRTMMSATVEQYCAYGAAYRAAQKHLIIDGGTNGTSAIEDSYPDW